MTIKLSSTSSPFCLSRWLAARKVPPVASRSSTIKHLDLRSSRPLCTSSVSLPYSSVYVCRCTGPGSLPAFRMGKKPTLSRWASEGPIKNPRDSSPNTASTCGWWAWTCCTSRSISKAKAGGFWMMGKKSLDWQKMDWKLVSGCKGIEFVYLLVYRKRMPGLGKSGYFSMKGNNCLAFSNTCTSTAFAWERRRIVGWLFSCWSAILKEVLRQNLKVRDEIWSEI